MLNYFLNPSYNHDLLIYLFGVLRRFQHYTGHIVWTVPVQSDRLNSALSPVVYGDIALSINTQYNITTGIGNQYIQLVKVLYCKLPTNGKQLPAFPLKVRPGSEPRSQRWEARVLQLSLWPSYNHEFTFLTTFCPSDISSIQ